MTAPEDYWRPVGNLVSRLRCWTRLAVDDGRSSWTGPWGMLLTIPTAGYLEASGGPVPIRHVTWVQIALEKVFGGRAGLPLEFRDVSEQVLAGIRELPVAWEVRQTLWSADGIFDERPVRVAHLSNPFWAPPSADRQ